MTNVTQYSQANVDCQLKSNIAQPSPILTDGENTHVSSTLVAAIKVRANLRQAMVSCWHILASITRTTPIFYQRWRNICVTLITLCNQHILNISNALVLSSESCSRLPTIRQCLNTQYDQCATSCQMPT